MKLPKRLLAKETQNQGFGKKPPNYVWPIILGIVLVVLVSTIVLTSMAPKRYDLNVGDIAPETIKANKDVEDVVSTEAKMQQARNAVPDQYQEDGQATANITSQVAIFFTTLQSLYDEGLRIKEAWDAMQSSSSQGEFSFPNDFITRAKADLNPVDCTDVEVRELMALSGEEIADFTKKIKAEVNLLMQEGIREDELQMRLVQGKSDLEKSFTGKALFTKIGAQLLTAYLLPNLVLDEKATQSMREIEANKVKENNPVTYKKSENIVQEGERITKAQWQVLQSLGLLQDRKADIKFYGGAVGFIFVLMLLFGLYLFFFEKRTLLDPSRMSLLSLVIAVMLLLGALLGNINPKLVPVAFAPMLVMMFMTPGLAMVVNIVISVLLGMMLGNGGFMSDMMFNDVLAYIISGSVGIYLLQRFTSRMTLVTVGFGVGFSALLAHIAMGLMTVDSIRTTLVSSLWGGLGGVLAAVLCLGTLPIWEAIFDLVTPMKLLELCNGNHPLQKKLLMEAPGTYHHSLIVGNMSERAAETIGANALLARAGAYFHDVGKLKRPYFFRENQFGGENPHDEISPELSAKLILVHPKDGLAYTQKHRLPHVLREIVLQHHGTSPLMYFYHKSLNAAKDKNSVRLDDFRYEGPKPQSREAAIVMLADAVEATVRTSPDHSQEKIEMIIRKMIRERLEDGQLDECNMTIRDLDLMTFSFVQALNGTYHDRVEYPDANIRDAAREETARLIAEDNANGGTELEN